jgi:predicted nucleic acid-binding protein
MNKEKTGLSTHPHIQRTPPLTGSATQIRYLVPPTDRSLTFFLLMSYINIMKRLYLDNCCLNRPFDDQRQLKIKLETDAKLFIQQELLAGKYELAWSYVLDYEIGISPFEERREKFKQWKDIAKYFCTEEEDILLEAEKLAAKKFKIIDALHISAAKYLHCDYIITTDRKMLNKEVADVLIVDPIDFLQREVFYED